MIVCRKILTALLDSYSSCRYSGESLSCSFSVHVSLWSYMRSTLSDITIDTTPVSNPTLRRNLVVYTDQKSVYCEKV